MTAASMTVLPFLRDSEGVVSFEACGLRLDIGRQRLTQEDLRRLISFAKDRKLLEHHLAMVGGAEVNPTEHRAALHTSLRSPDAAAPHYAEVNEARERMYAFAREIRSGARTGCRGDAITDVINVGIGGSEVGPKALYHAFRDVNPKIRMHFLSGVDGITLDRIIGAVDPYKCLVIVSSKSFHTRETLVNAAAIDEWFRDAGISEADRAKHMVVASANPEAAAMMRLPKENLFPMWDWVGGRFSVWGAVGLGDVIALGPEVFDEFLAGAHEMDCHVAGSPLERNLSALIALIAYWNSARLGIMLQCVLPYDERLRVFVSWEQQLEMESLGKTRAADGTPIVGCTGQGVWGGHGDESQHSFYQWLREGTGRTSVDLIWCEKASHRHEEHHRVLTANARAQAEALVTRDPASPYFNGVTAIAVDELTPRRLGALMAMYEHKTTMLGTLFGINPFDQPGVEYGKQLSREAEGVLARRPSRLAK